MKPTLFTDRCTACGRCAQMMEAYCITEVEGRPAFDESVCNLCQKCIAICPNGAIGVDGVPPERIEGSAGVSPEALARFFERRRSTKLFSGDPLPREVPARIVSAAAFAPNQNKNIRAVIIDDPTLIDEIDRACLRQVRRWYRILFGFRPITALIRLVYPGIETIRRKMILDLETRGRIVKKGAAALVLFVGNKRIATTEASAHHLAAAAYWTAEALGVGSCLMDSVKLALNQDKGLRRRLAIEENVLAVMALGWSEERVVQIPRGYAVPVSWNVDAH